MILWFSILRGCEHYHLLQPSKCLYAKSQCLLIGSAKYGKFNKGNKNSRIEGKQASQTVAAISNQCLKRGMSSIQTKVDKL